MLRYSPKDHIGNLIDVGLFKIGLEGVFKPIDNLCVQRIPTF